MSGFELVSAEELIETSIYPELGYSFHNFNRVQSTLLHHDIPFKDVNLVLGTSTSSGKTVCAALAIAASLNLINE